MFCISGWHQQWIDNNSLRDNSFVRSRRVNQGKLTIDISWTLDSTSIYTAKNAQPVLAWWKQHWTMLCCPHCSKLSTILFNIVKPGCRLIQAHQLGQYCWQPWTMWAAQHCSMLFSSGQNRLCVFLLCIKKWSQKSQRCPLITIGGGHIGRSHSSKKSYRKLYTFLHLCIKYFLTA